MKKFTLAWNEEFDGKEINKELWNYEIGYIRNDEPQYYTDSKENAYIEDSCLVIELKKTDDSSRPYTSASLNTLGNFDFCYGKLEMRAKLPYGQGIWPAFWCLGANFKEVGWPKCGEIDIMELMGGEYPGNATRPFCLHFGDNVVQSTIHHPEKTEENISRAMELKDEIYADDFHVFGMEWNDKWIKTYVDSYVYNKIDISNLPAFHLPHFVLVNLAMMSWSLPNEKNVFPQKYYIDWIRYYKEEEE